MNRGGADKAPRPMGPRWAAVAVLLGCCTADDMWLGAGLGWDGVPGQEEAAALAWAHEITAPAPSPPSPPLAPSPPMAPFVCVALPLFRWWWWNPLAWFDWAVNIGSACVDPPDEEEREVEVPVPSVPVRREPPVIRDARISAAQAPSPPAADGDGAPSSRTFVAPAPAGNTTFAGSRSGLVDRGHPRDAAADSSLAPSANVTANSSLVTNSTLDTHSSLGDWGSLSHRDGALAAGGAAALLLVGLGLVAGRGRKARGSVLLAHDLERSDEAGPSAVGEVVAGLRPKPSRAPPPDWWVQARQWGSDVK